MTTTEIKQIVDEVADLVSKYLFLQGYSGIYDSMPYNIAYALKNGFIKCGNCNGSGEAFKRSFDVDYPVCSCPCIVCGGSGKIEFKIQSLK